MFFSIDVHNGVAIYEQIVRQVKFAVADGTLRPGQLLPSVRVLSQQLAVNPNTLNRAFQQLQSEGIIESIRGRGLAVCDGMKGPCVESRVKLISERFRSVVAEALHAGLKSSDITQIVERHLAELAGQLKTISSLPPPEVASDAN